MLVLSKTARESRRGLIVAHRSVRPDTIRAYACSSCSCGCGSDMTSNSKSSTSSYGGVQNASNDSTG